MDTKALRSMTYGVYAIGVKDGDGFGGCIVDALAQISSGSSPTIILGAMNENYTTELIKRSGEFTVSVVPATIDPLTIAIFGFQSARDSEKWAHVQHSIVNGLPILTDAVSYMRLRVNTSRELDTHTAFTCDTIDAWLGDTAKKPLVYNDYYGEMRQASKKAFDAWRASAAPDAAPDAAKHVCSICGYVYNGETPFTQLPDDWKCPLCGAGKDAFELQ